jgi:2-hydroxy-6-oxonona-2,4-dienedioate hydrolase
MRVRGRVLFGSIAGALVGAIALFIAGMYQSDLQREIERVSSGSELADTRCGPIEYASLGDGPAVLLVHGAGGGFDQGLEIARELAAGGFRVVAMSRFGYLRTPLPADASPAAQADAHACLLDALGIERAAVIGISAGAPSSMQFALRHPRRATHLGLLVPLAYAPGERPAPGRATQFMLEHAVRSNFLYWAALNTMPSFVLESVLATPPALLERASAREQARVRELMRELLPLSPRRAGLRNDWAIGQSLGRYALERIAAPTLAISVKDDLYGTFEGARYTAVHIPGARFVGSESGGHVWIGHHEEILAELAAFLGKPERAQP